MALVRESSNPYSGETPSVTLTGGLSDAVVFAIIKGDAASIRTVTAATLDGAAADFIQNLNRDNGRAISTAVAYWLNAKHPGAGAVTLATTWSGGINNVQMQVIEYSGVDQSTPISTITTFTDGNRGDGTTLTSTLTGQTGELALSWGAIADSTTATAGGGMTASANLTTLADTFAGQSRLGVGEDAVVATASEAYVWTVSQDGSVNIDSLVTGSFAVFAAAGGATALLVNDLSVATTITSPAFVQHNALAVNDASVATTITEPDLIQHNVLVVDSLSIGTLITSPALIQHNVLAVNDLDVATTLSEAGLTQHNILAVNAMLVATEVTNVSLSGVTPLLVDDLSSGTVITQVTLDTAVSLLVDNLAVGTQVTSPQLTQHNVLVVDDMSVSTLLSVVSFGGAVLGCLDGEVVIAQLLDGVVTIQPVLGGETTIIPVLDGNVTIQ